MLSSLRGSELRSNGLNFDWSEIENNNVFMSFKSDAEFTQAFEMLVKNVEDNSTIEFIFDLKNELAPVRQFKNVIEYAAACKEVEALFFNQMRIRNQVIEGRYLRVTGTKKLVKELIEKYEDTPDSGKQTRIAMKVLSF